MKELFITLLSFADFWFIPLIFLFLLAIVVEQVLLRVTKSEVVLYNAMRIRRLLWQQNLLLNLIWIVSYFYLVIIQEKENPIDPFMDSGLIWK